MHRGYVDFFSVATSAKLVRDGALVHPPPERNDDGEIVRVDYLFPVYREMIVQITRDYSGLPDVRTLSMSQIRFFYGGLVPELKRATKPKG